MSTEVDRSGVFCYGPSMTRLLTKALEAAQKLTPEQQDELARQILAWAGEEEEFFPLTPEMEEAIAEADRQIARGETYSLEEVDAMLWRRGVL